MCLSFVVANAKIPSIDFLIDKYKKIRCTMALEERPAARRKSHTFSRSVNTAFLKQASWLEQARKPPLRIA